MSELIYKNIVKVDIDKPLVRLDCGLVMALSDEAANRFGALITKDGANLDVSNCFVKGYLIRPNEETLLIDGTAEGNLIYVDIPKNGYVYDGSFTLTIKVYSEEFKRAVVIFDGKIAKTNTDDVVDGDKVVYTSEDILSLIDEMEKARDSANEAAASAQLQVSILTDMVSLAAEEANKASLSIERMSVSAVPGDTAKATISNDPYTGGKHIYFTLPKGEKGEGFKVLGSYASIAELEDAVPFPNQGDVYNVGAEGAYIMHMWNAIYWDDGGITGSWLSLGTPSGIRGESGYTPVKGVDYWTDTDKSEMVSEVLAALPNASGVGF